MKIRKLTSVVLIALLLVSSAFALSSCGKKEENKPATLEEYVNQSEDAVKEIEEIGQAMENEILDGEVDVKENAVILTMKLKETYKSKDFESLAEKFELQLESYQDVFNEALESLENESGIEDSEIQIIVQNGDGEEIYSNTYTYIVD